MNVYEQLDNELTTFRTTLDKASDDWAKDPTSFPEFEDVDTRSTDTPIEDEAGLGSMEDQLSEFKGRVTTLLCKQSSSRKRGY